ncbi:hypothetical protein BHE97_08745 [Aeromicrobium sp. PE09-221]|uniref:enoyl-CoA hydratase/isomerase family protein n=1 Tax=Aeromicrobium sp. PE09-221 TaxID=1898043 RepID=UPI000B6DEF3D|nr:enoyl-CoA hydratase/isomerase family protein [Aeromicrobium sp. PE09-221]OUZ10133.1 hypothetical protein BHE97_08745 [Aeromicrobium sp. PE09-221]
MLADEPLLTRTVDGVLTTTLNRPRHKNALSRALREELATLWEGVRSDPSVRCVVVTGTGDYFSAGADVSELDDMRSDDEARGIGFTPAELDVPVVVALNGPCIGGALRFICDADVVLATEEAWLRDPHVTLGISSGPMALELVSRGNPLAIAPLILGGSDITMSPSDAHGAGLISEVVRAERLAERTAELSETFAAQPATGMRAALQSLRSARSVLSEKQRRSAWAATRQNLALDSRDDVSMKEV